MYQRKFCRQIYRNGCKTWTHCDCPMVTQTCALPGVDVCRCCVNVRSQNGDGIWTDGHQMTGAGAYYPNPMKN